MHADLSAQAADLYRAEAERVARYERLVASVKTRRPGLRKLWARFRTPRSHTLAA
ncbi:hypothetical protein [Nocardiopsis sp. JB363]|uniref:hypothetical protein n=1 Tax=Nocardiopsis sp. JB363 TaxID=1434837 RepID=UPI00097B3EB5|nr:hypothetical protein [Nocardiopsis sp. JB363]SIO84157.1 hypothetical protein BQ8420_00475 [Nocardiopsis sp. JB363]